MVQELIQTVKATTGSAELLPDLGHVALIPNGDVVAIPGSPEPANPVRHAAVMLQLLIEGVPAPPELEQFVARNVAQPPQYDTVAEFSRNLAFFERPGRRSDVERLVGRALGGRADQPRRRGVAAAEGARLRSHAGHGPAGIPSRAAEGQDGPDCAGCGHRRRDHWRRAVVVVAGPRISGARLRSRCNQAGASGGPAPPAESASAAAAAGTASRGGAIVARCEPLARPATGATAQPPAAAARRRAWQPRHRQPTSPQGERSLLDRASDAVRSAVNSIVRVDARRRRRR